MQTDGQRQNKKKFPLYFVSSTFFLVLLFIAPLSAFAEDKDSIDTLRRMGKAFASIAEKASPAVVGLKTEKTVTQQSIFDESPFGEQFDPFNDDFFDFFFRRRSPRSPRQSPPQRKRQQIAQGSGFIISSDGYILTNNHMVDEAEKVEIELADERKFTAEIIGTDPESDVAVVKIDAEDLPFLKLADSDTLEVGEWVLAIGNPLGLSHTVTAGIVSAKGRSGFRLATYENFIQTDAAINFGNSGGPLIDLDGEVVGINTAIVGPGGNIGIGFAIPINMAKNIYEQLIESGKVVRGYLGVIPQDMDPEMAEAFGLKTGKGVAISEVTEGSAADKAGLKHNDIVLELNGEPVESADVFRNQVAMLQPDTEVKMVIWRDGKRKTLTAKLDKRPPIEELAGTLSAETTKELGFTVQNLTEELAQKYGYEGQSGVIVNKVEPGSEASQAGIVTGTLIKEVDRKQVKNTKEFNEAITQARKKGKALLLVKRDRYTFFVLLPLTEK